MTADIDKVDIRASIDAAAALVERFRKELLEAGYTHGNATSELCSQDKQTWVRTSYTHGEYSIYVWRRPRGHGEIAETQWVFRVRSDEHKEQLVELCARLCKYAKKNQTRMLWPPAHLELAR